MTVEIISWSISIKVWDQAGMELATPGSAHLYPDTLIKAQMMLKPKSDFSACNVYVTNIQNINYK